MKSRWLLVLLVLAACSSSHKDASSTSSSSSVNGPTVTVIGHQGFLVSDAVLQEFTDTTGIKVNVVKGGDATQLVDQAIADKAGPKADVLYGVDNFQLQRALDAGIFDPYQSFSLGDINRDFDIDSQHRVTPIDELDVCVNYDQRAFDHPGQPAAPTTIDDLVKPEYQNMLVVENPSKSPTGLGFLIATVQHFGEDKYLDYWRQLKANGAKVVDDWSAAYVQGFSASGTGQGDRPIVVSYASSPAADAAQTDPPKESTDVKAMSDGCFRQLEFAGVLAGAAHPAEARQFIDFMLSKRFQEDIPGQMFVYPVRDDAALPDVFTMFSERPIQPVDVDPATIAGNAQRWLGDWASAVAE